jgi:hypothetical protein
MSENDEPCPPMTPTTAPRALGAFGFAAYMRSGFKCGDEEMIAAKFETLGNRIEALEGVVADIMQYDLWDIFSPSLILRMEEMKVVI